MRIELDEIKKIKERPRTRAYDGQRKFLHLGKEFYLHELIEIDGLNEEQLIKRNDEIA